uniref:Uncharacterized protein n=1 Tax=Micrurus corallinus TaxID=54390 RepID=A0A2D4FEU3_MICCO
MFAKQMRPPSVRKEMVSHTRVRLGASFKAKDDSTTTTTLSKEACPEEETKWGPPILGCVCDCGADAKTTHHQHLGEEEDCQLGRIVSSNCPSSHESPKANHVLMSTYCTNILQESL